MIVLDIDALRAEARRLEADADRAVALMHAHPDDEALLAAAEAATDRYVAIVERKREALMLLRAVVDAGEAN